MSTSSCCIAAASSAAFLADATFKVASACAFFAISAAFCAALATTSADLNLSNAFELFSPNASNVLKRSAKSCGPSELSNESKSVKPPPITYALTANFPIVRFPVETEAWAACKCFMAISACLVFIFKSFWAAI